MLQVLIDSHHTRVFTDSYHTMPKSMRDKIHHLWITSNDHFTKQIHLFSNQKLFGCNIVMIIYIHNSCVFCGATIFWCCIASFAHLNTFTGFPLEICITTNTGSFTRWGIYPCLLLLDTSFLYYFIQLYDFVGRRPTVSNSPNQSPNAMLIITIHSHPFNAMSPCICNAMHHCMLYHATCIMNATWITQSTPLTGCHGQITSPVTPQIIP